MAKISRKVVKCPYCNLENYLEILKSIQGNCEHCKRRMPTTQNGVFDFVVSNQTEKTTGLTSIMFESHKGDNLYSKWVNFKHLFQRLLRVEDHVIGLEDVVQNKTVIDVGCGPSLNISQTEYPHRTCSTYVGVDNSIAFIESAKKLHEGKNHFFLRAEATNLPFADKSFEIGTLLFTLHHVKESPTKVLMEISRVSSNKVVIFDHIASDLPQIRKIQNFYWKVFDGGYNYLTKAEWEKAIDQAGLRIEKMITSGILFRHVVKLILTKSS